ncbi:PEGA domain-containing protein [Acidobacteriota bacterium]
MTSKRAGSIFAGLLLMICPISSAVHAQKVKVKVIVDSSSINESPQIGSQALAQVVLNTILDAEEKQGAWYKVVLENEGVRISGYIHEMLVEEITDAEAELEGTETDIETDPAQAELIAGIELQLDESRSLVRQKKNFDQAIAWLKPLTARTFRLTDHKKQKRLAAEIYLWRGLAYAGFDRKLDALSDLKYMFEVDLVYAKEITRNIFDPTVIALIDQAEREFKGLIVDYSVDVISSPEGAAVFINNEEIGIAPIKHTLDSPQFTIRLEKEGYKTVDENLFVTDSENRKEYFLVSMGRQISITSQPKGIRVVLDGRDTGLVTDCVVPYTEFGQHTITLSKPDYTTWEQRIDILEGEGPLPVNASLTVNRYEFLKKWTSQERNFYKEISGIAVDPENYIYVSDRSGNKIKKFSQDGQQIKSWGAQIQQIKDLKEPAGVAVDQYGNVYITDARKHTVNKFSKAGKFIRTWGKEGRQRGDFDTPMGIATDAQNNVYVVDSANHRIKKYSVQGDIERVWGRQGNQDGQFTFPKSISISPQNEVYVVDQIKVHKFTAAGDFISSWSKAGTGDGEVNNPYGICIDSGGYVYIADTSNNRIQKFDPEGNLIAVIGGSGASDGKMTSPYGVVVDNRGFIFVADRGNNRIQVFAAPSQK